MARRNTTYPTTSMDISPVDALWVLIQSQTKAVRDALTKRLLEDEKNTTNKQEAMVKDSLTRAFEELHADEVYDDARSLFDN
ncbi:MAG: hypothetical protein IJK42_04815 [Prevotella sp.]|nr:hypothetical protein [Prevotella sp.]